jgi:excisionase family DNA binding protein
VLSVKAAADRLGVSTALIYSLCAARRIRHRRVGLGRGKILIPEDALEEFGEKCTVRTEEAASEPPPPKPRVRLKHLS